MLGNKPDRLSFMNMKLPLMETIPPAPKVRDRLKDAIREVKLLTRFLRIAESADEYRRCDRQAKTDDGLDLIHQIGGSRNGTP